MEVGPCLQAERSALRGLLPKSVREVIHVRLSRLSPAGSELLGAGAVLERGFDETLVRVADLGEAESLRALDELIERHLLRRRPVVEKRRCPWTRLPPTRLHAREDKAGGLYRGRPARRRLLHQRLSRC